MDEYEAIGAIELTAEEQRLYDLIPTRLEADGTWERTADAMEALFKSLVKRAAIPEVRLKVFNDPDFAEVGRKSPRDVFHSNGRADAEIIRHPHFVEYLRYFIFGPQLPVAVIEDTTEFFNDFIGTSGMLSRESRKKIKEQVRSFNLDRLDAAQEFFRLGVEIGLSPYEARGLKEAAQSVRK